METSGIREDTLERLGWWSCDAKELARTLQKPVHSWQTGIAIPYPGVPDFVRVRYDVARLYKRPDGSVSEQRYDQPKGSRNHLYILPEVREAILEGRQTIFITEGEKKAVKATQEGFPCIAVPGVWNVVERAPNSEGRKTEERIVLPELEKLPWARRKVVIIWDSDARYKAQVMQAGQRLAGLLKARGAEVRFHVLDAPPGRKMGLDDYLVEYGPDAFRRWLEQAPPESLEEGQNFEIERIRIIQTDPPIYEVTVFGRPIQMNSATLLNFYRFRAKVLDATYRVVSFKQPKERWAQYVENVLATRSELEQAPSEASSAEQLWWEIRRYIASHMSHDPDILAQERGPYRNEQYVFVHVHSMLRHLSATVGKLDPAQVWVLLRQRGGISVPKWVQDSQGNWVCKRVCQLELKHVLETPAKTPPPEAAPMEEASDDELPF